MNKELITKLVKLNGEKEAIEKEIASVKSDIEKELSDDGYKDDSVTIYRTPGSKSTSIDLKELEKKEPNLYNDLLKDYPKENCKKEGISYRFAKQK